MTDVAATRGPLVRRFRRMGGNPFGVAGAVIVVVLLLVALLSPWIVPYPEAVAGQVLPALRFAPPSLAHPFGANELGQDIFSLVIAGSRVTLFAALAVVIIGTVAGTLIGGIAGYAGGWIDEVLMRTTDLVLSLPSLIMAIAVAAALGPGIPNMVVAIAVSWWPSYARLIRGEVLSKREELFVVAARAAGAHWTRILGRHILPNISAIIIVRMSLDVGYAILTIASLGFIGIGVRPPTPEWGVLLSIARLNMPNFWWTAVFPGLAIFVAVLGFNLFGDGVRLAFDPRSRA